MVTERIGYEAVDGKMFPERSKALEYEMKIKVGEVFTKAADVDQETAKEFARLVVKHRVEIAAILGAE